MTLVICNKAGIGNGCTRCDHAIPHEPLQIDDSTCKKHDDCSLYVNGIYQDIRVKCKGVKGWIISKFIERVSQL